MVFVLQLLAVLTCKDICAGGHLPLYPQLLACDNIPYAALMTSILLSLRQLSLAGTPLCSHASTFPGEVDAVDSCMVMLYHCIVYTAIYAFNKYW